MSNLPKANTTYDGNRFIKRAGQLLVVGGVLTLVLSGPLQPRVAAMRAESGVYIPDARYQFTAQEVEAQGKILSHTFTLYNGRGQPVRIEANASCGCTGLSWQIATLPPFGRKEITAKMNSSNRSQSTGITFKLNQKGFAFANLETQTR